MAMRGPMSAIVEGIVSDSIDWEEDPDFGFSVASGVVGVDDEELLQPRRLYERQGRDVEYRAKVESLLEERRSYLSRWPQLRREIVESL